MTRLFRDIENGDRLLAVPIYLISDAQHAIFSNSRTLANECCSPGRQPSTWLRTQLS